MGDRQVVVPAVTRRRAALARCPRCRSWVLAGTDDLGLGAALDPQPVTRAAELALILAGRATAALERGEIVRRDRWRIRRPSRHPVLAVHVCGRPVPPDALAPLDAPPTADLGDQPPF